MVPPPPRRRWPRSSRARSSLSFRCLVRSLLAARSFVRSFVGTARSLPPRSLSPILLPPHSSLSLSSTDIVAPGQRNERTDGGGTTSLYHATGRCGPGFLVMQ